MAGRKLKTAGKQKPVDSDEAGMLSDALRAERMRKALSDLHDAMDGNSNRLSSRLDGVSRGEDWPEIVTI